MRAVTFRDVMLRFWPLLALQLVLAAAGLVDIRRRKAVKHLPKPLWAVFIVLGGCIGPILYFAVGRGEE